MIKNKLGVAGGVLLAAWAAMMGAAFATADSTAVTVVGGSAGDLKDTLVSIATTVLPYAAALLAITLGWRFAKKFVRG